MTLATATRFDDCLDFVLKAEGGYSNDPADRGGATSYGVTQQSYDGYRRKRNLPLQPVKFITQDEAATIYKEIYWEPFKTLPAPLDLVCFDAGVNCGTRTAAKWLQVALDVPADGVIGEKTRKAIEAASVPVIVATCLNLRRDHYDEICERDNTQYRFLKGWTNRVNMLEKETK